MIKDMPEEEEHAAEPVESSWGKEDKDHYGYESDEERRQKRGLEDWELVDSIPTSQKAVPKWFIWVIVAVAFLAISLSFPFFGRRAHMHYDWGGWGFGVIAAIVYLSVMSIFVLVMVRMYGSKVGGRLDHDEKEGDEGEHEDK